MCLGFWDSCWPFSSSSSSSSCCCCCCWRPSSLLSSSPPPPPSSSSWHSESQLPTRCTSTFQSKLWKHIGRRARCSEESEKQRCICSVLCGSWFCPCWRLWDEHRCPIKRGTNTDIVSGASTGYELERLGTMQFDIIALWFCLEFIMPGTQLAPVLVCKSHCFGGFRGPPKQRSIGGFVNKWGQGVRQAVKRGWLIGLGTTGAVFRATNSCSTFSLADECALRILFVCHPCRQISWVFWGFCNSKKVGAGRPLISSPLGLARVMFVCLSLRVGFVSLLDGVNHGKPESWMRNNFS